MIEQHGIHDLMSAAGSVLCIAGALVVIATSLRSNWPLLKAALRYRR